VLNRMLWDFQIESKFRRSPPVVSVFEQASTISLAKTIPDLAHSYATALYCTKGVMCLVECISQTLYVSCGQRMRCAAYFGTALLQRPGDYESYCFVILACPSECMQASEHVEGILSNLGSIGTLAAHVLG